MLYYHLLLQKHPKQRQFHNQGKDFRRRLFFGGNRSGKTTGGRFEALAHLYGYRFWEVPNLTLGPDGDLPPRDSIPPEYWVRRSDGIPIRVPNLGMIVSGQSRSRGIGETIWPGMEAALPAAVRAGQVPGYKVMFGPLGVPEHVRLPNGSKCLFASKEQDDIAFESLTLDWAWIDEPVRQPIYRGLWTRLTDYCGPLWLTLTPITADAAWLCHAFYFNRQPDVGIVEVRTAENPFMTPEKVRALREGGEFDANEAQARLEGIPQLLGSRVYETFRPDIHVVRPFPIPASWPILHVVDPHHKRPSFMIWAAYDPTARIYYLFREWPTADFFKMRTGGLPPEALASTIRHAEGARLPVARICDPRFGKALHMRHGAAEPPWIDRMAAQGLIFDADVPFEGAGTLEQGHTAVADLLHYNADFPISPTNTPHLLVFEGLENTIRSLTNYAFCDERDSSRGVYRRVAEDFKDPADCVRYLALYPIPPSPETIEALSSAALSRISSHNEDY